FSSLPPSSPAIYSLSLHDALPILSGLFRNSAPKLQHQRTKSLANLSVPFSSFSSRGDSGLRATGGGVSNTNGVCWGKSRVDIDEDRKSTRLNSSHEWISYAVFCLK